MTGVDPAALRKSWGKVVANGDAVPSYFYSALFLREPRLRDLFPVSMAAQRDRLVTALGRIVADVDNLEAVVPFLQGLGREHRKFGVVADNYPTLGEALLETLEFFLSDEWDERLSAQWLTAYQLVSQVMVAAAADSDQPPWWDAQVTRVYRPPNTSIAVLTLVPHEPRLPVPYVAGQSIAVQTPLRPREWRWFSPASAPRADTSIELHVTAAAGGQVSPALVYQVQPGDQLRIGAPVGQRLTLAGAPPGQPLLLVAGGTGLAPLRALVEQVAAETEAGAAARRVTLVHGARRVPDLYDLRTLHALAGRWPWLSVLTAVSDEDDPSYGQPATAADVAVTVAQARDYLSYVCGPPPMVATTVQRLADAGYDPNRIRTEEFDTLTRFDRQVSER